MLLSINRPNLVWRPHERETAKKYFGGVHDVGIYDIHKEVPAGITAIRWWLDTEETSNQTANHCAEWDELLPAYVPQINPFKRFAVEHSKIACFEAWQSLKIRVPNWVKFETMDELVSGMYYAAIVGKYLLRLDNSVAGYDSWLLEYGPNMHDDVKVQDVLNKLNIAQREHARTRLGSNKMCVEYIDTSNDIYNVNVSYRIIVAGNEIITGYARVSSKDDWVAITNKFDESMANTWLTYNKNCHRIMAEHHDEIVNAVQLLGLDHQGIDIIQDGQTGKLYFLEVQPTYDAGFVGRGNYKPPYYSPYNPALLEFINDNWALLKREIPLYINNWLNKYIHFDLCYKAIKESFQ